MNRTTLRLALALPVCALVHPMLVLAGGAADQFPGYQVVSAETGRPVPDDAIAFNSSDEAVHTIAQKNKAFEPAAVSISAGQAIEIINDDDAVHNVFCHSGEFKYNSGPQKPGSSARVKFPVAGTYEVRCAIHPKMKLTVTVSE